MPPVVTALERQQRRPERVSVFVDGEFAAGLPAAVAADLGLAAGKEISDDMLETVRAAAELDVAVERALRFLRARPRSVREVERRLARYGYGAVLIGAAVEVLTEKRFLDDAEFAAAWVRDRLALKPKGRRALRVELAEKGVAADVIDGALAAVEESEEDLARRALAPRAGLFRARGPERGKRAVEGYLARRGFTPAVARRLADEVFEATP